MNLSEHFTYEEFVLSQEAARHGLDNTPTLRQIDNLERLCAQILEPLRKSIGKPLHVSSGYRSPAVNAAVGGAKNSDHMQGLAADLTCPPLTIENLMKAVHALSPSIPLKKAIIEFNSWVHVSCTPENELDAEYTPQFLAAARVGGEVQYSIWSDV